MKIENVSHVAAHRLCIGCGACTYACPEQNVRLIDILDDGIRPFLKEVNKCRFCQQCLSVCPGIHTSSPKNVLTAERSSNQNRRWGSPLEIWEGYAGDPEVRLKGSSGGLCSALSLFCMETGLAGGTVHIGSDDLVPWQNKTYLSRSRDEIISRTGSRYAPASPCDGFGLIEKSDEPVVFIGKPCDISGLAKSRALFPLLDEKVSLSIGFFCAGTPSSFGTLKLLRDHNINPDEISQMKYRGKGWPGYATVRKKGHDSPSLKLSYQQSWGFLQKYRPFRCYLCPDLTAELADISVGDPWYREIGDDEPGRSLILIRTEKGRDIFHKALNKGDVVAQKADLDILYRSQNNLLSKRQEIWGRILALKLLRIAYPKLVGFHLFDNYKDLAVKYKIKSVLGTVRRCIQRNYFKPRRFDVSTNDQIRGTHCQ